MPNVSLTPALREQYEKLFNSCVIRPEKATEVSRILTRIALTQKNYE